MKRTLTTLATGLCLASVLLAADQAAKPGAATAPAAPKADATAQEKAGTPPAAAQPSAEQVLNELLRRRAENPLIEPARAGGSSQPSTINPRSNTVGTAPKASQTALRREGQFVITRRGRMVRGAGDSSAWMFVFEADANNMQDPPMYLMPCTLLEDMEGLVQHHGDSAVFLISGQVFVYRGANYLLPTLMRLSPDKGNLKP